MKMKERDSKIVRVDRSRTTMEKVMLKALGSDKKIGISEVVRFQNIKLLKEKLRTEN